MMRARIPCAPASAIWRRSAEMTTTPTSTDREQTIRSEVQEALRQSVSPDVLFAPGP